MVAETRSVATDGVIQSLFVLNPDILKDVPPGNVLATDNKQLIRLLFLDIDGVLNSHKTQVVFGETPFPSPDVDKGYVDSAFASDIMAAELINKVCESTGAYIVLSSSWRIGNYMKQIPTMLESIGIDHGLVLGRTGHGGKEGSNRGHQIEDFLKDIANKDRRKEMIETGMLDDTFIFQDDVVVESYAIVDDDGDMLPSQKSNFVQTTFMEGLTCMHAIELGRILSSDDEFYLNRLAGIPSSGAIG
jgi:hypothetical protein